MSHVRPVTFRVASVLSSLALSALLVACGSSTDTPSFVDDDTGVESDVSVIGPADVTNDGSPSGGGGKPEADADAGGNNPQGDADVFGGADTNEPNCETAPFDFGCPCEETGDCVSGFCVEALMGYICTDPCVETCPEGWNCLPVKTGVGQDVTFACVPKVPELCAECASDDECGGPLDHCVAVGAGGNRCAGVCESSAGCPDGYTCQDTTSVGGVTAKQCVPVTGSCECTPELDGTSKACFNENEFGTCIGQVTCDGPNGWTTCTAKSAAAETCDGVDNDCNGVVDEGFQSTACITENEHGACPGMTVCMGLNGSKCDAPVPSLDLCDGIDNDCDGLTDENDGDLDGDEIPDCNDPDIDGDGDPNESDCKPYDDTIYTGATELCDGIDNDCNLLVDELFDDTDGDDIADCIDDDDDGDGAKDAVDCAPKDGTIFPGATDVCDGVDNDCSGEADEDPNTAGCNTYFLDADQDGAAGEQTGCFCAPPAHYYDVATDCNDGNSSIYPGAEEVCNKVDDNCNGSVDEGAEALCVTYYFDGDSDDYGVDGMSQCTCGPQGDYKATQAGDCNDGDASIHPGAAEACNGVNDNCNDAIDEGVGGAGCNVYFFDGDGDTYGVASNAKCMCAPDVAGHFDATEPGDCNDADAAVNPGATEACNGIDDNCASGVDDGCDDDGDDYCDANLVYTASPTCPNGGGDCNDFSPKTHPNAKEVCNNIDDDCDGLTDEDVQAPCGGCSLVCQLEVGPTGDEPFDTEGFNGVSPDEAGDLKLDQSTVQFHMLWVANSAENTVSKIDTETGKEVARYNICGNPSRTAVDLDGNCYAGCRSGGGVAKILLDPNTCKDKNGNGVIETSVDLNNDGKISGAELLPPGTDECIAYITVPSAGENIIRAVAVDKDNHPWVGGWDTRNVFRLNPNTGAVEATVSLGGVTSGRTYGFAIDQEERLWIALRDGAPSGLAMVDLKAFPLTPKFWPTPGSHNAYGLAIDSLGKVWFAGGEQRVISRFDPNTQQWTTINMGDWPNIRGVAASPDGRVFAAHQTWGGSCDGDHYISVYDAATVTLMDVIDYSKPGELRGPVGLAMDFSGNLWAINQCGSTASKINPDTGEVLGTYPTGAAPYTYSDMTGFALKTVVAPEGTYLHTFKGWEGEETQWYQISVGVATPIGTFYEVEYRTAETLAGLAGAVWSTPLGPYPPETMPIDLTDFGQVTGKYLQVRITLVGSDDDENPQTPLLKSIDVVAAIKQ